MEDVSPGRRKELIASPYEETKELREPLYLLDEGKEKIATADTAPLYLKRRFASYSGVDSYLWR